MKKLIILIIAVFVCVFLFAVPFTAAEQKIAPDYVNVQIFEGDSLWDIASSHPHEGLTLQAYINEIKTINGLKSDRIFAGRFLIVPTYSRGE